MRSGTPGNSDRFWMKARGKGSSLIQRRALAQPNGPAEPDGPLLPRPPLLQIACAGRRRGPAASASAYGDLVTIVLAKGILRKQNRHSGNGSPAAGFYNKCIRKRRGVQLPSPGYCAMRRRCVEGLSTTIVENGQRVNRPAIPSDTSIWRPSNTFVLSRTSNDSVSLKMGNNSGPLTAARLAAFDRWNLYPSAHEISPVCRSFCRKVVAIVDCTDRCAT